MIHFENRFWRILVKCEKLAGFWPYYSKRRRLAVKVSLPLIILSCTSTVIIRGVKEWNVKIDIVLECALLTLLHFCMLLQFSVCMLDEPSKGIHLTSLTKSLTRELIVPVLLNLLRQEILEQIATHMETLVEEAEVVIFNTYYNKAWTLCIKFIVFAGSAFAIYDISPVAQMSFYYFLGNGTFEKQLPFYVDYLVDEQEYFYYILAHLSTAVFISLVIEFNFALCYFLTIRHVCALFEIVKLRLKEASEIVQQVGQNEKLTDLDEQKVFKIILSAVEWHNEAIQLSESVEEVYRNCLFVILISNMAGLTPLPLLVMLYLHSPFEICRRSLVVVVFLVHFYVIFLQGQMIIDHSSSLSESCYDFYWYNSSKRCQVAISIMMMQSLTPRRLTGVLFDLSMETYCAMLKTALSYISMFTALDVTIEP